MTGSGFSHSLALTMLHDGPNQDPLFVKITENADAAPGALQVTPLQIKHGDTLAIAGRPYNVEPIRTPEGAFTIRDRHDDLRGNIGAFELLRRAGALPADCEIDDLCLRNPKNGDCMIELRHDGPASGDDDPLVQPRKRHFFARFDAGIQNPHLNESAFDAVVVRASPCMFGTKSARLVTTSGLQFSLIERSAVVDEPIAEVITRVGLSLYEREILRRMLGVITLLVRGGKVSRLVTAFPRGAYYSFLLGGAAIGLVRPETMLVWFDRVDERVAMLRERFVGEIGRVAPELTVEQYSFMDSACEMLRGFFQQRLGRPPEPFDITALLDSVIEVMQANDPFARHIFASGVSKPATFRELADLTYAVSNLVEMAEEAKRRALVIGVYDPTENIMWNVARKLRYRGLLERRGLYSSKGPLQSKLDTLSYVGIMPLEQVIFDVSSEYADRHLGGASRLIAVQDSVLASADKHMISGIFAAGGGKQVPEG